MKRVAFVAVFALAVTALVSCAPASDNPSGNASDSATVVNIVASTNVYGSIAEAVAGPHATVTSIIDSPAQDPHAFEAGARVQLELSRADVVISNGGGYDDFVDTLMAGAANSGVQHISAVEASGFTAEQISQNEHVWYDLNTATTIATMLADALARIDPPHATEYHANAQKFSSSVSDLSERVAAIAREFGESTVMVTEPVPLYLLAAAGLTDVTPHELSKTIENGNGVPPAVMNASLTLLRSGNVSLFVYNEQTEGPETAQLLSAATKQGVPSLAVTETIPDALSYLAWMSANIQAIEKALQ